MEYIYIILTLKKIIITSIIDGDNIYYFVESNDKYEYYKTNIYNNKKELVGFINKDNNYCYIEGEHITCSNENGIIIYNHKFEKIYDGESAIIIPYKDNYMKVLDTTIYYDNKEYRKVNIDSNKYNVYNYDIFNDNLFIYFGNFDGEGCIYNVAESKCEDYKYYGIKKYSDGLYYFDDNKIYVTNTLGKVIKEYNNILNNSNLYRSVLNNEIIYYFTDDYLKIYNLEKEKVSLFDYRININVDEIYFKNNLLYLVSGKQVYIINVDKIAANEMTIGELNILMDKKLTDKLTDIYDKYAVDIKIKDEANLKFTTFKESMTGEKDYDTINDSLDYAEEVLNMFGKDFFKEFIHDEYTGVRIYLVSEIKASFDKLGEAFRYYDKYAIVAQSYDFKRTLCHELMHTMEDAVIVKRNNIFEKWSDYNPIGFKYKENYNYLGDAFKYTIDYKDADVYFIDNYSETFDLEDRARVFENICMNTTSNIKMYPYLLKKAEYEKEEILKYYPMLKDSVIFDSLN